MNPIEKIDIRLLNKMLKSIREFKENNIVDEEEDLFEITLKLDNAETLLTLAKEGLNLRKGKR